MEDSPLITNDELCLSLLLCSNSFFCFLPFFLFRFSFSPSPLVALFALALFVALSVATAAECSSSCDTCENCPVDCYQTLVDEFTGCNATESVSFTNAYGNKVFNHCNGGVESRSYTTLTQPMNDGRACNDTTFYRECAFNPCPVGGECYRPLTNFMVGMPQTNDYGTHHYIINLIGQMTANDFRENRAIHAFEDRYGNDIVHDNRTVRSFTFRYNVSSIVEEFGFGDQLSYQVDPFPIPSLDSDPVDYNSILNYALDKFQFSEGRFGEDYGSFVDRKVFVLLAKNAQTASIPFNYQLCNKFRKLGIRVVVVDFTGGSIDSDLSRSLRSLVSIPARLNYIRVESDVDGRIALEQAVTQNAYVRTFQSLAGPSFTGGTCNVFGNSRIQTFDGSRYRVFGAGDYWLTGARCTSRAESNPLTPAILISQVRMVPCDQGAPDIDDFEVGQLPLGGRTCARGYVFSNAAGKVEVQWNPEASDLRVYVNGEFMYHTPNGNPGSTSTSNPWTEGVVVTEVFQNLFGGYEVKIDFLSTLHSITLRFDHLSSSAIINASPQEAQDIDEMSGLCGDFDLCPNNDFKTSSGVVLSKDDSVKSVHYNFAESWRVGQSDSLFQDAYSSNYNAEEWVPEFSSSSANTASRKVCDAIPEAADLRDTCASDVRTIGSAAVTHYELMLVMECQEWCFNGAFRTRWFIDAYRENNNLCETVCRSSLLLETTDPTITPFIHTIPNDTSLIIADEADFTPIVDVRGNDLPSASLAFHPRYAPGGTYTFQRKVIRNDMCYPTTEHLVNDTETGEISYNAKVHFMEPQPQRNVTVSIACLDVPDVSVLNPGRMTYSLFGFPTVYLRGGLTSGNFPTGTPQKWFISWVVTDFVPRDGESRLEFADAQSTLAFANSWRPRFTPSRAGVYTIELALTDGCAVSKASIEVVAVQKCCTPTFTLSEGPVISDPYLSGSSFENFDIVVENPDDILCPEGSSSCVAGTPWPLGDNGATRKNLETVLDGFATSMGGNFVAFPQLESNSSTTRVYSISQLVQPFIDIANTTGIISTEEVEGWTDQGWTAGSHAIPDEPAYIAIEATVVFGNRTYTRSENVVFYEAREVQPEIEKRCGVTVDSFDTDEVTVTLDFDLSNGFDHPAAVCEGYYAFSTEQNVVGYGDYCVESETTWVHASCGTDPSVIAGCDRSVRFDYDTGAFPDVTIDLFGHTDESKTSAVTVYRMYENGTKYDATTDFGCTYSSGTRLGSCTVSPDKASQFSFLVEINDNCGSGNYSLEFESFCDTSSPRAAATTSNEPFDGVNDPFTTIVNATTSTSLAANTSYEWNVVSVPTYDARLDLFDAATWAFGAGSDFAPGAGETTTFVPTFPGTFSLSLTADDGCLTNTADVTVEVTCVDDITIATTQEQSSVTYVASWPSTEFSSTTTGFNATFNIVNRWYASSTPNEPVVASPTLFTGDDYSFTPTDGPGVYTITLWAYDGCRSKFEEHTLTAVCSEDAADPSSATAVCSSTPCIVGEDIELTGLTTGGVATSYEWSVYGTSGAFVDQSSQNTTFTPAESGTFQLELTTCTACGECMSHNISLTAECTGHDATFAVDSSVINVGFDGLAFPRVDLNANPSNLAGNDNDIFTYSWTFVAAPAGSVYEPLVSTTVEDVNNESPVVIESESGSVVVTNTTYNVTRTYSQVTTYTRLKNCDDNEIDTFPASFFPDLPGDYVAHLTISTSCFDHDVGNVTITTTCNNGPIINLADNITHAVSPAFTESLVVDASATADSDGDELTYEWNLVEKPYSNANVTLTNTDFAVLGFHTDVAGEYILNLLVSDGCSEATQNVTIDVIDSNCIPVNFSTSSVASAWNYLGRSSGFIKLDGGDWNPVAEGAATNARGEVADADLSSYPAYKEGSSFLYTYFTQSACDTVFEWELVDYTPEHMTQSNPCRGNSKLIVCGGEGNNPNPSSTEDNEAANIDVPTGSATGSASDSSDDGTEGWEVALIVVGVIAVLTLLALLVIKWYRNREPEPHGAAAAAAPPVQRIPAQGHRPSIQMQPKIDEEGGAGDGAATSTGGTALNTAPAPVPPPELAPARPSPLVVSSPPGTAMRDSPANNKLPPLRNAPPPPVEMDALQANPLHAPVPDQAPPAPPQ